MRKLDVTILLALLLAFAAPGCSRERSATPPPESAPGEGPRNAPPPRAEFVSIQRVSPSGATVVIAGEWLRDAGLELVVEGGAAPIRAPFAPLTQSRTAEASVQGLSPDTAYRYRVMTPRLVAPFGEGSFRTPPLPGVREVTFAVIGDTGEDAAEAQGGPSSKGRVVTALLASTPRPELVLHTGDVVYPDGAYLAYRRVFFGPMGPLARVVPIFPSLGNHDAVLQERGPLAYAEVFATFANNPARSELYYSFDWGDAHFVSIDVVTTPIHPGSPQAAFIDADLAGTSAAWKIAYFHYPPFSDGPHGDNADVIRSLVPLFEVRKVDLVLAGHDHVYERMRPRNGVLYVVSGGGGAGLYPLAASGRFERSIAAHHFVRGRVSARRLLLEAVDTSGAAIDTVELRK